MSDGGTCNFKLKYLICWTNVANQFSANLEMSVYVIKNKIHFLGQGAKAKISLQKGYKIGVNSET